VASITVEDASTLAVTPWEKSMVPAIEKAIRAANLGLNPVTAGQIVRVPLPPLTEERRKELVKLIRGLIEEGKVAIRTGRREANMHTKELLKAKKITEDDERRLEDNIQKLTDKHVVDLEKIQLTKENELMKI
jgi:ribosome recycling factor